MSVALDPGRAIDRLTEMWTALSARVRAAGIAGQGDIVTQEIWSHGAAITVRRDGERLGAFAINSDGRLMEWNPCCGWTPVEEERS